MKLPWPELSDDSLPARVLTVVRLTGFSLDLLSGRASEVSLSEWPASIAS